LVATIFMIGVFFSFVGFLNVTLPTFVPEGKTYSQTCMEMDAVHIREACDYAEKVRYRVGSDAVSLTMLNGYLGYLQTFTFFVRPLGVGFLVKPFGSLRVFTDIMGVALNSMGLVFVEMWAHILLLEFIDKTMLLLFLPLGLAFRSVVDHPIGGIFIALALGLYIVYPFTLILNNEIVGQHYGDTNWGLKETLVDVGVVAIVASAATLIIPVSGFGVWTWSQITLKVGLSKLGSLLTILGGAFVVPSIAQPILASITEFVWHTIVPEIVYTVIVMGMILPIVNILITLTCVRELAKIMGAEINLSSLTKLI
ncbi:hypothetical protein HY570_04395, partial [Candidatus Micrarchaeota archaeon]|nr:hypothetical protein [Candidatus Micrarchaeota archaeon]